MKMRDNALQTGESDRGGANETTDQFATRIIVISPSYHIFPQHNTISRLDYYNAVHRNLTQCNLGRAMHILARISYTEVFNPTSHYPDSFLGVPLRKIILAIKSVRKTKRGAGLQLVQPEAFVLLTSKQAKDQSEFYLFLYIIIHSKLQTKDNHLHPHLYLSVNGLICTLCTSEFPVND